MFAEPPADTSLAGLGAPGQPRPVSLSFEEFYEARYSQAVGFAFLLTRSHETAQDLVHDAMTAMHKRWSRVDNPDAYLRQSLVNNTSRWRYRAKREREHRPTGPLESTDRVDDMWDAISRLPNKQRVAVTLRFYADLSYPEIAELMGVPEGTAKSAISRALDTLRKEVLP